jgi:hypothetical protein
MPYVASGFLIPGPRSLIPAMCPICSAPDSASLANGIRAGALTLVLVSSSVLALVVRFAWQLWRRERANELSLAVDKPEGLSPQNRQEASA